MMLPDKYFGNKKIIRISRLQLAYTLTLRKSEG
jgi:hypothetical protein